MRSTANVGTELVVRHAHARLRDLADRRPVQRAEDLAVGQLEAPARGEDREGLPIAGVVVEDAPELDPAGRPSSRDRSRVPLGAHPDAAHLEVHRVAPRQQQGAPQLVDRLGGDEDRPACGWPGARGRCRQEDPEVPDRRPCPRRTAGDRARGERAEGLVAEEVLRVRAHFQVGLRLQDRGARPRRGASRGSPSLAGCRSGTCPRRALTVQGPLAPAHRSSSACSDAVSSSPLGARQEPPARRRSRERPRRPAPRATAGKRRLPTFLKRCMGSSWLAGHGGEDPGGSYRDRPQRGTSSGGGGAWARRFHRGAADGAEVLV